MGTLRVLVLGDDPGAGGITTVLGCADDICKENLGAIQEAILFVAAKNCLQYTTLETALGEQNAKLLRNGGTVALPSGVPMRLETIRTLKLATKPSVLISIYSDDKMLDQVESKHKNLFAIVAHPSFPEALDRWQKAWSPLMVISDRIVTQALVSLTQSINLSNRVLNPRDKEHAERTLKILRIHGRVEDPENIRSWAIQNGWQLKAADELEKLALKVFSLKSKPRLTNPDSAKTTYDYWCSKI